MTYPLTIELGKLVAGTRPEDIPANAVEQVAAAFADTIGVMLAGVDEPAPQLLRKMLNPSGSESMLVTDSGRASAMDAAWINGTAAHALDYDDVAQQGGHASAVLVPAILAEGEALGSSGSDMARAYVVGYEVFSEVASRDADQHHNKGWHPTGIFGAIGAAAACASLRRLNAEQTAMAIALGASQSSGVMSNFGTMTKPFHAGRAAHAGVASARLAALGFTASLDALEHAPGFLHAVSPNGRVDAERILRLKKEWALVERNRLAVKKYPMCYCAHRALDGALDLKAAKKIDASQVAGVKVSISPRNAIILRNHAPVTGLEAKFSMEFAMASTLSVGRAGLNELQDGFVQRQDIQELMQRVKIEEDPRENSERPGYAVHDRVTVTMRDGTVHDSGPIVIARGDPEEPLQQKELWNKFEDCVRASGRKVDADRLFSTLMSLGKLQNLGQVVQGMRA